MAIVVPLVAAPASAGAQEPNGVFFQTAQPLTLTKHQLRYGKAIEVCNGSASTARHVHVIPVDFDFKGKGTLAPATAVLAFTRPRAVAAGACVPVIVKQSTRAQLEGGEYAGSLLLLAGRSGSARLSTTVTIPSPQPSGPGGAGEPTSFSIHSSWPWSRDSTSVLLLKAPGTGEQELALGKDCTNADRNESDCPRLGNLYQGSHIVRVSVGGRANWNRDKGVQELPIRLEGFQHPVGDYEGTLALPGTTRAFKVSLTAKDAWYCAVLALLLGTALALLTQLWNGRFGPRRALLRRANALVGNYGDDYLSIVLDRARIEKYAERVREAISRYGRSVVMFEEASAGYKAIDASLKLAEEDADVFASRGGLRPVIERLDGETNATIDMLAFLDVSDVPAILSAASELLRGSPLAVGAATKRVQEANALIPVLIDWRELAEVFMTHVVWLEALTKHAKPTNARQAAKPANAGKAAKPAKATARVDKRIPRDVLFRHGVEMSGLRGRLFEVRDAGGLAALRGSSAFWQALEQIAYLGQLHGVARPDLNAERKKNPGGLPTVDGSIDLRKIGYDSGKGRAFTFAQVLDKPAGAVIEPAKPARLAEPSTLLPRFGDGLALAVTVAVSIVAGLSTFYFTKSFGAATDYLTVIVIGSAAQTLLKAVLDQTSILLHDLAPDKPAVPAKVIAPS